MSDSKNPSAIVMVRDYLAPYPGDAGGYWARMYPAWASTWCAFSTYCLYGNDNGAAAPSLHGGGGNFLFCDGHVEWVKKEKVNVWIYREP